jgi:hypothetical protein
MVKYTNFKQKLKNKMLTRLIEKKYGGRLVGRVVKQEEALIDDVEENKIMSLDESIKDHFFSFQLYNDLFTLLYSTLIFKWIQTDRVMIIAESVKQGYQLELFLKFFKINSVFLDSSMPVGTNRHFSNQFLKGVYTICIVVREYINNSPQFARDIIEQTPIPATIIYFNITDSDLMEYHCFNPNVKAIYHFISRDKKQSFSDEYMSIDERINFSEFTFDNDQMHHLRYRCEDIFHSIKDNDIKKSKAKKINQELLHSKNMQDYFKSHPDEKVKVVRAIEENSIKCVKPSAGFLPNYLIHDDIKNNQIAQAISTNYGKQRMNKFKKRKGKGTMEKYIDSLDKNDGSHSNIKL